MKHLCYYYSQLSPCGHPAIADARYYGQNPDPRQKTPAITESR